MNWQFTIWSPPLWVGVFVLLMVTAIAWRRRKTTGAQALAVFSVSSALYAAAYALEISSLSLPTVKLLLKIQYIGILIAPIAGVVVVLCYIEREQWVRPRRVAPLLAIPLMTLIFAWTNDWHELIWQNLRLDTSGNFTRTLFEPGIWYWVNVVYYIVLLFVGVVLLVRAYFQHSGVFRRQILMLVAAFGLSLAVHLLYIAGVFPDGLDANSYSLIIVALVLAWGLFRFKLFDLLPVAREMLLTSLRHPVIVVDDQQRVVHVNDSARALLPGDVIGQKMQAVIREWAETPHIMLLDGAETPFRAKDRSQWFEANVSPLTDRQGSERGHLITLHDVTERKEFEDTLTQTNDQLTLLRRFGSEMANRLEVHYVAQVALDAALRISSAEAAWLGLVDRNMIRVVHYIGNLQALPPVLPLRSVAGFKQTRCFGQRVAALSYLPGGQDMVVLPLYSIEGELIGVMVAEATKRKRLNEQTCDVLRLLSAQVAQSLDNARMYEERTALVQELEAFAHTVAHDLKSPLATIIGYSELVLEEPTDDSVPRFVGNINRLGQSAVNTIEALLTLSSIERQSDIEMKLLDMPTIIDNALLRMSTLIEDSDAEIILPERWLPTRGYAPWVEEIWANYINNAVKYGGAPPRVALGSDLLPDGEVRCWVSDNGKGISMEEQAKLFRPFTRLSQLDSVKGHGLGLSIVQRIAERLNGRVGVESAVGEGSTFYFTLPAAPKPQHIEETQPHAPRRWHERDL